MFETKECRGCKLELPIEEFYKHSQMADGHLNYCKYCVKERVAHHRRDNIDKIRQYDRDRGKTEKRKTLSAKNCKKNRRKPGYMAAHDAVEHALKNGSIKKPISCPECGGTVKIEAHHFDYSQKLDIAWLCAACHRALHSGKTELAIRLRKKYKIPKAKEA